MIRTGRTNMCSARTVFFALAFASLSILPFPAQALLIQFCIPVCQGTDADPAPTVFGPGTPVTDENGVVTNSMSLGTFMHTRGAVGFTITATVTSQQSATLQKITFNPTSITATSGSPCSTTSPCRIEVIATTDQFDFPAPKPSGGYPAGAFMIGSFTGPQAASPNGDTISATAEASGLSTSFQPVSTDVVNAAPGTGPGNTGT